MTDRPAYASPAALHRALTDRLKSIATEGRWVLPQLRRQVAYDRRLERLYFLDDSWIVKGATALLARDLGMRGTIDVDVYRARANANANGTATGTATAEADLLTVIPVIFASSGFVAVGTMPGWLPALANDQPFSFVVNAVRALTHGGPAVHWVWLSADWFGGLLLIFVSVAISRDRRL